MNKYWYPMLLLATCAGGCYKEGDLDPQSLEPNDVITAFEASKSSLLADGSDTCAITVVLPENAVTGLNVVFSSTEGVFLPSNTTSVTAQTALSFYRGRRAVIAQMYLRNGLRAGTIQVRAAVQGVEQVLSIPSTYNFPTGIELTAANLVVPTEDPADELTITAKLRAATGTVSLEHAACATAWNTDYSEPIGSFRSITNSDPTGNCTLVYSLVPDSIYVGEIRIIATTLGNGTNHTDTLTVYAIN